MANEYLINRADLVSVADAIRTKGETTEQLVFPGGFVAAIEGMETGKTGATLTVTTPAEGITVTVAKGELSYTQTTGADGTAVFPGLESGTWTITISDGAQTATGTVDIDADYVSNMTFFSATINVTYPAGLVCTATDGVTTLTAPDTSGTWDCVVPNAGAWTFTLGSGLASVVDVINSGATLTVNRWYLYKNGIQYLPITKHSNYASYVTLGADSISFNGGTNNIPQVYTQKIDTNHFRSLNVTVSVKKNRSDGTMSFGLRDVVNESLSDNIVARKKIDSNCDSAISTLDISGYPGNYMIYAGAWGVLATVTEIWLEV